MSRLPKWLRLSSRYLVVPVILLHLKSSQSDKLSALSVSHSESTVYGAFGSAQRAMAAQSGGPERQFSARASVQRYRALGWLADALGWVRSRATASWSRRRARCAAARAPRPSGGGGRCAMSRCGDVRRSKVAGTTRCDRRRGHFEVPPPPPLPLVFPSKPSGATGAPRGHLRMCRIASRSTFRPTSASVVV
jgi:hypothetical protein